MIEQLLIADRLLAVDQVDQAEAIYRRVAQGDPLAAMAVVGLARCALARGHDRRAYELAARALAIDPEEDMARRMEARLAEVLTLRGEPVERPPQAGSAAGREARSRGAGAFEAPVRPEPPRRGFFERLRGR